MHNFLGVMVLSFVKYRFRFSWMAWGGSQAACPKVLFDLAFDLVEFEGDFVECGPWRDMLVFKGKTKLG